MTIATNADLYLGIARLELDQLKQCTGPITVGSEGYSEHFRHAIVATVFSAFAVEHAITEVIWIDCFLRTPSRHRQKTKLLAEKLRTIPDKLEFLQRTERLSEGLVKETRELFERRNRLVHLRSQEIVPGSGAVISVEDVQYLNQQGRGPELDSAIDSTFAGNDDAIRKLANEVGKPQTHITLPGLSPGIVSEAPENFGLAERALEELRREWNTHKPRRTPKRGQQYT